MHKRFQNDKIKKILKWKGFKKEKFIITNFIKETLKDCKIDGKAKRVIWEVQKRATKCKTRRKELYLKRTASDEKLYGGVKKSKYVWKNISSLCYTYNTIHFREQNNPCILYFSTKKNLKIILNTQCFLYTMNTKLNTYSWSFFLSKMKDTYLLYSIRHLLLFIDFYFILKAFSLCRSFLHWCYCIHSAGISLNVYALNGYRYLRLLFVCKCFLTPYVRNHLWSVSSELFPTYFVHNK